MDIHCKHENAHSDFAPDWALAHSGFMNAALIRKARGLNQIELAEMTGLTQSTISRAESGDEGSTLKSYIAIAAALNVRLADLFSDERSPAEQVILDIYRKLSPERQKGWVEMARLSLADPTPPNQQNVQTGHRSSVRSSS